MSKIRVTVHDDVRRDVSAACDYLGQHSVAASQRFVAAYGHALETIEMFPLSGSELFAGYRRKTIRGFAYAVIYRHLGEEVRVLAVISMRRDPTAISSEIDQRS